MYSGPHIKRDGLVFGYDTGYNANNKSLGRGRHFKGPVSDNILEVLNYSRGNTSGTNGFVQNGEEVVKIPKVGRRTVKYVEYYNNHSNAGSLGCCPNLFYYHDGYVTGVESSTPYTYSIIYKHTGNYTHPNFMYRYEHQTSGTYNTEQGIHSTARRTHLGNGWYHAWGTFTTQSTTTQLRCYSFLYNYGTTKYKFYVAAISIVKNTSGDTHLIVPPHLMLQPNNSISSTQSLIDLKRSTSINVLNAPFDTNGGFTFDGTDTGVQVSNGKNLSGFSAVTYEGVINGEGVGTYDRWFSGTSGTTVHYPDLAIDSSGTLRYLHSSIYPSWVSTGISVTTNVYNHIVFIFQNNGNVELFVNGSSVYTASHNSGTFPSVSRFMIGNRYDLNGEAIVGKVPLMKIYNRALTAQEVKQNFRAYKTRFDI